jgi:transcriptional regulator with XRE-family HTH domain
MFTVKEARIKAGITQQELADTVGTTREYLSNIENGHKTPSFEMLDKIAKVLKTSVKDLIKETA